MIDEVLGDRAPEHKESAGWNWLALERIPKETTIILLFNPGLYQGKPLLLPSSCLQLRLQTTYRSSKRIANFHTSLCKAMEMSAPSGNPSTEVVGQFPRLVVLGDLGDLDEEEAAERIEYGLNLLAGETGEVTLIDNNSGVSSLLARQAEGRGWTMKNYIDMYGAEADNVIVVGIGNTESISRARLCLGIMLMNGSDEVTRKYYNVYAAGYQVSIEKGSIEVAIPLWHPQVKTLRRCRETMIRFLPAGSQVEENAGITKPAG